MKVGGRLLKALMFADDQTMMVGSQTMMDRLNTISIQYGMNIDIKKTKGMRISKGAETIVRINIGERK